MSGAEKAVGVVKSVLLFRETLERIQAQLGELRSDLKELAANHTDLDKRVVRIETMIEMSAARPGQAPRIEG